MEEIKVSTVRNLIELELPDGAYLYLVKGLNFVEAKPLDQQDLRYDAQEFLRKLEWRTFFHQVLGDEDRPENTSHPDLRIPSRRLPDDFQNTVVESLDGKVDTQLLEGVEDEDLESGNIEYTTVILSGFLGVHCGVTVVD